MDRPLPDPLRPTRLGEPHALNEMPFVRNRLGLWVPPSVAEAAGTERPLPDQRLAPWQILTTIGWNALTGETPRVADVTARLQRYSLRQIVAWISRITLALHGPTSGGADETEMGRQLAIASRFQIPEKELRRMVERAEATAREDGGGAGMVLFHERQTLNLLKLALLVVDADAPNGHDHPVALLEALMMMNDIIEPQAGSTNPSTPEGLATLDLYLTANLLFNQEPNGVYDLVRSHFLFVEARPEIANRGGIDVPAALAKATGLEPRAVLFALFALSAFFETRRMEDLDAGTFGIRRSEYLSTLPKLNLEQQGRWFGLAASNLRDLQHGIRSEYSLDDLGVFDVLPFEKTPLVTVDDDVFCISLPLLRRLRGNAIQHRLMDESLFDEKSTGRFRDTLGHLVEHYTSEMLSRAFGDRFISEKALRECAQSRKVCDGVIVYADALILVECKTASPKLETRHGTQDYPTYRKEWSTRAVNAADQFESTIQLLREGAFVSLGLEPGQRRDLYPVMGVFELLIHPVAYRVIRQVDLAGHSLLERMRRSDVKPLQLFQIREMELIEVAASAGKNVAELLRAKTATDDAAAMSLINFVFESGETFQKNFGPWHARRYWELADEASEYMKALGLGGASGGDAHSNEPHAQTGS